MVFYSSMLVQSNAFGVSVTSLGGIHDMVDYTNRSILAKENITASNTEIDRNQVPDPLSRSISL